MTLICLPPVLHAVDCAGFLHLLAYIRNRHLTLQLESCTYCGICRPFLAPRIAFGCGVLEEPMTPSKKHKKDFKSENNDMTFMAASPLVFDMGQPGPRRGTEQE